MSNLYIVATPIGCLEDITFRAVRILKEVDCIYCEDTRQTRKLLHHYDIPTRTASLYQGQEDRKTKEALIALEEGKSIALVSDAGTPTISDPGYRLVSQALQKGYNVLPVPGASAVIAAVSAAGLPTDAFIFDGFLPVKPGQRKKKFESWKDENRTIVFFVSPHKLIRVLNEMKEVLGDIQLVLMREITKKFEERLSSRISELEAHFKTHPVKGEFVGLLNLSDKVQSLNE